MIYVVTGFMRSFTSMMMRCLEVGGLDVVKHRDWDERHRDRITTDYHPNPHGYYEASEQQKKEFYFDPRCYEGRCLKLLANYGKLSLPDYSNVHYKVILMLRDPEEIRESYKRFFGKYPVYEDFETGEKLEFNASLYDELMSKVVSQAENRRDVEMTILMGDKVISNPLATFYHLKDTGWPIEPWWSASSVDSNLYRNRIQETKLSA